MGHEEDCILHRRIKLQYLYSVFPNALLTFSLREHVIARISDLQVSMIYLL